MWIYDSEVRFTNTLRLDDVNNAGVPAFATPSDIQAAFFNGVYGSPYDLTVSCANGNCTWPSFLSFGVRSVCENITSESSYRCLNSTDGTCVRRKYVFPYTWATEDYVITADNKSGNHLVKSMAWNAGTVQEITDWNSIGLLTRFIIGRFGDYWTDSDSNGELDTVSNTPELTKCDLLWGAKLYENFTYQNVREICIILAEASD